MTISAPKGLTVTYQLQRRSCGKPGCAMCGPGGPKHGPYWYGYFRVDGKMHSFYVGKEKPEQP